MCYSLAEYHKSSPYYDVLSQCFNNEVMIIQYNSLADFYNHASLFIAIFKQTILPYKSVLSMDRPNQVRLGSNKPHIKLTEQNAMNRKRMKI